MSPMPNPEPALPIQPKAEEGSARDWNNDGQFDPGEHAEVERPDPLAGATTSVALTPDLRGAFEPGEDRVWGRGYDPGEHTD